MSGGHEKVTVKQVQTAQWMSGCVSRWKAILSEYRTTILKSHALLEKTGLTLFHIHESTLIRWYKNTLRVQAVRTLLQGLCLPTIPPCKTECFLEACIQPTKPSSPLQDPHIFTVAEDTSGQARVRDNTATMGSGYSTFTGPYPDTASVGTSTPPSYAVAPSTSSTPQSPDIPVTDTEMDVTTTALRIPKTTAWRHKKTARKNEQRGNEGLHLHKMWSYGI